MVRSAALSIFFVALTAVLYAVFIIDPAPISNTATYIRNVASEIGIAQRATVIFGGDMMFDRTIRTTMEENGGDFIFSCIDNVLKGADVVVANLEGPITEHPSRSSGTAPGAEGNYTFTFPTMSATLLAQHNVRIVNLGNNHILNFQNAGVRSTTAALDAAGVDYFGDPLVHGTLHKTIYGIRFAFINYNEFDAGPETEAQRAASAVWTARNAGEIPIVYTHWGIEYATTSPTRIQALAHEFIDAGAEIVIGSHPHVIEQHEQYMGKSIYYSLGNFIFDQYWNDDVRTGLLLKVVFDKDGLVSLGEIKVHLERDRRTCPVE